MKQIAILGSTGSIGVNALDVVRKMNRARRSLRGTSFRGRLQEGRNGSRPEGYRVWGLAAQKNVPLLQRQVREFRPRVVAVYDPRAAREMKAWARRQGFSVRVWEGIQGLERLAAEPSTDMLLSAVVGAVGLRPLLAAVRAGKKVALANKEALIVAGDLLTDAARKHGAELIPVDSEHSAIFQCLHGESGRNGGPAPHSIRRIILTASGGAFYRRKGSLNKVTVREALEHPTWKMGNKITIDCATLTNKGLEAIEAHHLFGVPLENIQILIHPQSIIHSLVEFTDGAMLAQLSHPDMRLPIQYALTHPERRPTSVRPLELEEIQKLEFYRPDFRRFPCLAMALEAGRRGNVWPAVFNGANEAAVAAFLEKRLPFLGIPWLVSRVLDAGERRFSNGRSPARPEKRAASLDEIMNADQWSRQKAAALLA